MIPSPNLVGIGITTKDRWEALELTLDRLREHGFDGLETVVIDDGSRVPVPEQLKSRFPWVRFERFETSEGVMVRRNQLARLLTAKFYFSLDDDSHPVAGSLAEAAAWLTEHPQVCALGFHIISPSQNPPEVFERTSPYPVRYFIGCANLCNRELFLALGGYETRLLFYGEEPEFCLRAFQQGYETYFYPTMVVRHIVTQISRNLTRQTYYLTRNEMLTPLWLYPKPFSYFRAMRFLPLFLWRSKASRVYWFAGLKGAMEAIWFYCLSKNEKQRLSRQQFQKWFSAGLPNDPR